MLSFRTSLRGSKKLQSLANGKAAPEEEEDDDASDKGYANESYVPGDTSLREDLARREQQESIRKLFANLCLNCLFMSNIQ